MSENNEMITRNFRQDDETKLKISDYGYAHESDGTQQKVACDSSGKLEIV